MVSNLMRLAESDVYVPLLQYYRNVKSAADMGDARGKVIYEDLKPAFIKKNQEERGKRAQAALREIGNGWTVVGNR